VTNVKASTICFHHIPPRRPPLYKNFVLLFLLKIKEKENNNNRAATPSFYVGENMGEKRGGKHGGETKMEPYAFFPGVKNFFLGKFLFPLPPR